MNTDQSSVWFGFWRFNRKLNFPFNLKSVTNITLIYSKYSFGLSSYIHTIRLNKMKRKKSASNEDDDDEKAETDRKKPTEEEIGRGGASL